MLLCRIAPCVVQSAGQWTIPGGGLDFGEDPVAGMIREVREETGLDVECRGIAGIDSELHEIREKLYHSVRILYFAAVVGGQLRNEVDGTTDMCQWWSQQDIESLPMVGTARLAADLAFSNDAPKRES